jgi:DNA-binding XRE family transcriptional regulator
MGFEYRIRSVKYMTLREKLIALRDKAGISQMSLAHQLDVSRQAVSRWES